MTASELAATLDGVAAWVESGIARDLKYMVPPDDGAVEGVALEYAHPSVFQMFVPSVERLKPGERQAPNIAVQLMNGIDDIKDARELAIRLMLTIWAPGQFDGGRFVRDSEGWRSLFNGLGAMVSAVENAETIAGCAVDRAFGVQFGMYESDREIPDLYPFWMGRVDFRLRRATQANKRFNNML